MSFITAKRDLDIQRAIDEQLFKLMGWQSTLHDSFRQRNIISKKLEEVMLLGNKIATVPPELATAFADWFQRPSEAAGEIKTPICRIANWPNDAPFALFLSTDIDQIHDREIFRWLGDVNHLRRHWFKGEQGQTWPCIKRILRPIFRPIDPIRQFHSIRSIQSKHGWKSTFYLLEDKKWARLGGRFNWEDAQFKDISQFLLQDDCELGIHGSAYSHMDLDWWKTKCDRFEKLYGMPCAGSRNHYLSLAVPETWSAQNAAGLRYDSTFGYPNRLGAPGSFCFPFKVPNTELIELPLTIMDVTLFRYLGLNAEQALETSKNEINKVTAMGGLVSILWHNNFFEEEEYQDWETTYEAILDWAAGQNPWNATGADIAKWWAARNALKIDSFEGDANAYSWKIKADKKINNFVIEIHNVETGPQISSKVKYRLLGYENGVLKLHFDQLENGQELKVSIPAAD